MPTNIIQTDAEDRTYLRIEGDMLMEDAVLLERLASQMIEETGKPVTLDLADLDFLDSESAPVLKRIEKRPGVSIVGMEIFLQSAIDAAERTAP